MRGVIQIACGSLVLWVVTLGLGFLFALLNGVLRDMGQIVTPTGVRAFG